MTAQKIGQLDLERVAWLLEQLGREFGHEPERGELRRSLEESRAAWTAIDDGNWWKAFVEAGEGQNLRFRLSDCTAGELRSLLDDGAWVIAPTLTHGIASIGPSSGRKYRIVAPDSGRRLRFGNLLSELSLRVDDGRYRCLVVIAHSTQPHGHHLSPLRRLWTLLRPETGDMWTVFAFALVTGLLGLATPLAVEALVNTVAFGRLFQPVVILSVMLLAFLAFQAALRALQTVVVDILQRRLFARVAGDIAYRMPRTPIAGLHGESGRELVNRFMEIVTVQKVAAQFLMDGINLVLSTIIGMTVLAFYHPWLLGFDVILLGLIVFGTLLLGRGAVHTAINESKAKYDTLAWLEDLGGTELTFRHGGSHDFVLERTDRLTYKYLMARREHFHILMRQIIFALGLQAVASTLLLGLGGWLVINQQLSLGQLVASELIVATIVGAFAKLGKHFESYYDLMAAIDKLGHLFDLPIEDQGGLLSFPDDQPAEIDVHGVSYTGQVGGQALGHVNLHLESGARAALRGPSGSGKSLLLDLLFGIREASTGHISVNGIDVRDFRPDVYRRHVSLLREVEVFEGSVAENIHLGRRDISSADVRLALSAVGLLDDVMRLHQGMQTELGPHGTPLTSNQLRRLMLARAIVAKPRLLLIDGLLDALPDETSRDLMTMLCRSDQPWSLLIVSGHELLRRGLRQIHLPGPTTQAPSSESEASHHVG